MPCANFTILAPNAQIFGHLILIRFSLFEFGLHLVCLNIIEFVIKDLKFGYLFLSTFKFDSDPFAKESVLSTGANSTC